MHRLLLLTAHPHLYTTRRMMQEARSEGWDAQTVLPHPWWTKGPPTTAVHKAVLVTRPGTFSLLPVLRAHRHLAAAGAVPMQSRSALLDACDQWRTLLRLSSANIPTPPTVFVRSPMEVNRAIRELAGPPWILKARIGSKGSHVMLASSEQELRRKCSFLWGQGHSVLVQEDLRRLGAVRRLLVIDAEVVAGVVAIPQGGDFRSNWHRGGQFQRMEDDNLFMHQLAISATQALNLRYAGVDLIGESDVRVLEINASPGIEGLEQHTGQNLAARLFKSCKEVRRREQPKSTFGDIS